MSTADLTTEILENYKAGNTIDQIAEKLDIGTNAVAHTLRDNKVNYKCPETGRDLNTLKATGSKPVVGAGKNK